MRESAKRIGIELATLYAWLRAGRIPHRVELGTLYLNDNEVEDIRRNIATIKPKRGRPTTTSDAPTTRKAQPAPTTARRIEPDRKHSWDRPAIKLPDSLK